MNYKEVIEAKYNREAWQQLLHDIFLNKAQFYNSTSEVKVNSRLAKSALYIGRISLSDGESLGVYEVELADKVDIERNKRGIRDMLTKDWKDRDMLVPSCSAIARMRACCVSLMSAKHGD